MTITLLLLWALSGLATFVLVVSAAVFMFSKKKSKKLWISSGITAVLFIVFFAATGISSTMDQNKPTEVSSNNESGGELIQTDIGKQAEEDRKHELDLSEYKEADLKKLHDNGYEKQTKLKISNAQVIAVVEATNEDIGNNIAVHVDNIPAVIYDVSSKPIDQGAVYTFYGTPDEDGKMILVDHEQTEDVKPLPNEKLKDLSSDNDDSTVERFNPDDYQTDIDFTELERTPEKYADQKFGFYGKIIQVIENDNSSAYRIAIYDDYDRIAYVEIIPSKLEKRRFLEDDYVIFLGVYEGLISYETVMGSNKSIPAFSVRRNHIELYQNN